MTVVSWIIAAALVAALHRFVEPLSSTMDVVAKSIAIIGVAFAYVRLARRVTLDSALIAGVAWVLLCVIAEVAIASAEGHGWYELLGSPNHPVLRALLMIMWVISPALFVTARHER
jgi:hypothetical protein